MSSLFIVRVLLSQTLHDSSYVYKLLPFSNFHLYLIAIYRKFIDCRPDIAPWRSHHHDLFIFIVRVLVGQTNLIDYSSYVFKWLP